MYTKIQVKRSEVAGKVPLASDLLEGELAINIADGLIYSKKADGTVVVLGGLQNGSPLPVADPFVAGNLWNDNGTVRISDG